MKLYHKNKLLIPKINNQANSGRELNAPYVTPFPQGINVTLDKQPIYRKGQHY